MEFLVNYTWSKSIDDSSVGDDNVSWLGSFTSLQDPNKPWLERSLSTFDTPSVLKFSYSYDLPIGRGKPLLGNMPRVLEAIVGGWKTNGIWLISDGRPLGRHRLQRWHPAPYVWRPAAEYRRHAQTQQS